jgi:hypothetical protein
MLHCRGSGLRVGRDLYSATLSPMQAAFTTGAAVGEAVSLVQVALVAEGALSFSLRQVTWAAKSGGGPTSVSQAASCVLVRYSKKHLCEGAN